MVQGQPLTTLMELLHTEHLWFSVALRLPKVLQSLTLGPQAQGLRYQENCPMLPQEQAITWAVASEMGTPGGLGLGVVECHMEATYWKQMDSS